MQINILEAKNRLSELVKRALAGEEVIIANRGQPVARLVAAKPTPVAGEAGATGVARWLAAHPLPTHARRSAADIDADIARERQAWD